MPGRCCADHAVTKIKQSSCSQPAYGLEEKADGWVFVAVPFVGNSRMIWGHREVHVGGDKE